MALLEVRKLAKAFGGVQAVQHCSFSVAPGTITALIGPNGAGKTTVFNLIGGHLAPDTGTVTLAGRDITREPAWQRSRLGLSRTFQQSRLFANLSLRDNLVLAIRQDDDRFWPGILRHEPLTRYDGLIVDQLRFVGLNKSLDTPVREMSYGEQKLFDLARALLNPHCLLLLDEPVAGVNPVVREQLKTLITNLKAGGETTLLIEHDMDFVRSVAGYVVVLDQGSVLAAGDPSSVLRQEQVLTAYLGAAPA